MRRNLSAVIGALKVAPPSDEMRNALGIDSMSGNVTPCHDLIPPPSGDSEDAAAEPLSAQQLLAIARLLSGQTVVKIATSLNVSERTIHRWKKQPEFAAKLNRHADDAVRVAATRLRSLMLEATRKLKRRMSERHEYDLPFKLLSNKRIWDAARVMPVDEAAATD